MRLIAAAASTSHGPLKRHRPFFSFYGFFPETYNPVATRSGDTVRWERENKGVLSQLDRFRSRREEDCQTNRAQYDSLFVFPQNLDDASECR